jgi:Malic enzyme, NAD binding domain
LEDISAPRCFEIEDRLKAELDIPVFHDDQHGTAVVVLAALLNALKITSRRMEDIRIVIVGLGAAGVAVARILIEAGAQNIIPCDSRGAVHVERADYLDGSMSPVKRALAEATNPEHRAGAPAEVKTAAAQAIADIVPPGAGGRGKIRPSPPRVLLPTPTPTATRASESTIQASGHSAPSPRSPAPCPRRRARAARPRPALRIPRSPRNTITLRGAVCGRRRTRIVLTDLRAVRTPRPDR